MHAGFACNDIVVVQVVGPTLGCIVAANVADDFNKKKHEWFCGAPFTGYGKVNC